MKINDNIKTDLMGEYDLANCPKWFLPQARSILEIARNTPYDDYETVTELDKWVTARYWVEYDGYAKYVNGGLMPFGKWYIEKATNPEVIARAMRWLRQNNYIIIKEDVQKDAERKADIVRGQLR